MRAATGPDASSMRFLEVMVASALVVQLGLLVELWWATYHPLPWHDEWDTIEFLRQVAIAPGSVAPWFSLHNEHRLFLARLVYAVDFWAFRGLHLFTFAVSACLAAGIVALFVAQSRAAVRDRQGRLLVAVALASLLLCGQQASNFLWAFQVQWFLVHFFAVASVAALTAAAGAFVARRVLRCRILVVTGIAAAIAANYSTASGNLVWPAAALVAVLLRDRLPKWTLPAIILVAAVSIGAYANGFRLSGTGSGSMQALVTDPPSGLTFLAAFFGVPFAPFGKWAAVFCGALFASSALFLVYRPFARRVLAGTPTEAFAVGLLFFVACVGLVTTAGRLGLGVDAALESRLASVVVIGWAALVVLGFERMSGGAALSGSPVGRSARSQRFAFGAALSCLIVGLGGFVNPPYDYRPLVDLKRYATSALVTAAADVPALQRVGFPDAATVGTSKLRSFILANHRSVFAAPAAVIGRPMNAARLAEDCRGNVDSVQALASGSRATGWAWKEHPSNFGNTILLADRNKVVVGIGSLGDARQDLAKLAHVPAASAGWTAHVRPDGEPTHIYILSSDGRSACEAVSFRTKLQQTSESSASFWPPVATLMFNAEPSAPVRRVSGLSLVESFGRWSNAKLVVIEFDRMLPRAFELELVIGGYGPNIGATAEVIVGAVSKGLPIVGAIDQMRSETLRFTAESETDFIAIVVPRPTVPRSIDPRSGDERSLGLALQSLTIRSTSRPPP